MKKLSSILILIFCSCATAGVKEMTNASSGEIGCSPKEIVISDDSGAWGSTRTWTATCKGKKYYCSGGSGSMKANCSASKD